MKNKKNIVIKFILIPIIIGLFSCAENPTETDDPPNIWDPSNFRVIDFEATWSPNGNQIAYVHGDTLAGLTGIYLIDINGSNKRLLLSDPSASTPVWTPCGNWIVFEMYAHIWKIKESGDSLTQLTFEGRNFFPSVSPNGSWIAFDSNVNSHDGGYRIWKMRINGENKSLIVPGRMPYWSENIEWIFYIGLYNEIYRVNLSNINETIKITHLNENNIYATDNGYPKINNRVETIAFTSQAEGKYPQIWIVNMDGSNPQELTKTQGYTCDWSPDGKKIVYTDSRAENGLLWIMNSDGSKLKKLTFN